MRGPAVPLFRPLRAVVAAAILMVAGCAPSTVSTTGAASELDVDASLDPTSVVTATPSPSATAEPTPTVEPQPTAQPTETNTAGAEPEPTPAQPASTAGAEPEPAQPASTSGAEPTSPPPPAPKPTPTTEPTSPPPPAPEPTPTTEPEPTPAPTSTAGPSSSKVDLPPSSYSGDVRALRTAGGVVMAVRGRNAIGYEVVTPCYDVVSISDGLELTGPLDILIDPGHGGDEPGAVGPNGLKESAVNLQVAELLRTELLGRGYSVVLTRYSDHRVAIQSRAELANSLAPRIFMSIHHNGGYPEPFPVAGTEVYVQLDDPESARLGGLVFEEVQKAFADVEADWMGSLEAFGVASRQNREGTDLYGVLRRTPDLVSVLTEAMYVSTEAEAELLAMPETLETEAQALANAVERFLETDDPGTGHIDGLIFRGDLGPGGGTDGCVDPNLN